MSATIKNCCEAGRFFLFVGHQRCLGGVSSYAMLAAGVSEKGRMDAVGWWGGDHRRGERSIQRSGARSWAGLI